MNIINKWKDKITGYVDTRLNLVRLSFIERTSGILGLLVFIFICLFLSATILLFAGNGLSEYFSALTESRTAGYFITSGLFLLLLIILFITRKTFLKSLSNMFIRTLTDNDADDKEDEEEEKAHQ